MSVEQKRETPEDDRSRKAAATPWLEWLSAGIGLVLTLGVLGSIGWQAVRDVSEPPVISIEVERTVAIEGGYRVDFQARNMAGATASQVEIEGRLADNDREPEIGRVTFDYIPGHSARRGGMFFTRDPVSGPLSLRALGFANP